MSPVFMRDASGAQVAGSSPGGSWSGGSAASRWRARTCSLRRRKFSRNARARRASRAACSARRAGVRRGTSVIAGMERAPHGVCQLSGRPPEQSLLDAHADLGGEYDRNRLLGGIFGGLVRMGAPPRLDPGAIAIDRGPAGAMRGVEGSEHRIRRDVGCRIDCRAAPHHGYENTGNSTWFRFLGIDGGPALALPSGGASCIPCRAGASPRLP